MSHGMGPWGPAACFSVASLGELGPGLLSPQPALWGRGGPSLLSRRGVGQGGLSGGAQLRHLLPGEPGARAQLPAFSPPASHSPWAQLPAFSLGARRPGRLLSRRLLSRPRFFRTAAPPPEPPPAFAACFLAGRGGGGTLACFPEPGGSCAPCSGPGRASREVGEAPGPPAEPQSAKREAKPRAACYLAACGLAGCEAQLPAR